MARKNISKVIDAFKAGKACKGDSKGTCSTDGETIYSYRMPIARKAKHANRGKVVLVRYESAPTATTRAQVSACEWAFPNAVRVAAIDANYTFRSLAGESGYQDRFIHRKPPRRVEPIGYTSCACRDCMEIVVGAAGVTFCDDCTDAECALDHECRRTDAYLTTEGK